MIVRRFGGFLSHAFVPGDKLGRWELVRQLGGGGFAAVWLARAPGPGGFVRMAAVKVIRPGRAHDKRFQDMLLDEARLVARIAHPAVAQIWEVAEDPRSLYFVMELVDGDSLDELRYRAEAAGKELPLRAVFRVLADICGGLHAAHELELDGAPIGIVHRDVSPQNILVSRTGNAKLIDFGIAKAKERLAKDTTSGFIKGKVVYMAPEQARADRDVDRRADVWAIGAVAYEIIEGRPPIEAQTDIGRLAALVGPAPVPPMSARVPAPLRAVVARALEKDREQRQATALELKEALEEALITSELETSEHDVAEMLAPWFPKRASDAPAAGLVDEAPASPGRAGGALAEAATDERPVSSTVELPPQRVASDVVEIPKERPRLAILALAAALVGAPVLWWATSRGGPVSDETAATAQAPPPPSVSAAVPPGTVASGATATVVVTPDVAPPQASVRPATTVAPSAPSAPRVQGKPPSIQQAPAHKPVAPATSKPVAPRPPKISDDNAIE